MHRAGAALSLALWQAQETAGLSPTVGHSIHTRIDQAQGFVTSALGSIAAGHTLAKALGDRLGAPTAYGPVKDPEEQESERRRG